MKVRGKEEKTPQTPLHAERGVRGVVRYERVVPVAWDADVARAQPNLEEGILKIAVPKHRAGTEKREGGGKGAEGKPTETRGAKGG